VQEFLFIVDDYLGVNRTKTRFSTKKHLVKLTKGTSWPSHMRMPQGRMGQQEWCLMRRGTRSHVRVI